MWGFRVLSLQALGVEGLRVTGFKACGIKEVVGFEVYRVTGLLGPG